MDYNFIEDIHANLLLIGGFKKIESNFNGIFSPTNCYFNASKDLVICAVSYAELVNNFENRNYFQEFVLRLEAQNLKVMMIWEDIWNHHKTLIIHKIKSILNQNITIDAKNCTIIRIEKNIASEFMEQNHIFGYTDDYYKFAFIYKSVLIGVATFSKPRTMKYENPIFKSYEMVRYCSLSQINIVGGTSKMLQYFIEYTQAQHLISQIDMTYGSGKSYAKAGFRLKKISQPNLFEINPRLHSRKICQNHEIKSSETDIIYGYDCGNATWEYKSKYFPK